MSGCSRIFLHSLIQQPNLGEPSLHLQSFLGAGVVSRTALSQDIRETRLQCATRSGHSAWYCEWVQSIEHLDLCLLSIRLKDANPLQLHVFTSDLTPHGPLMLKAPTSEPEQLFCCYMLDADHFLVWLKSLLSQHFVVAQPCSHLAINCCKT